MKLFVVACALLSVAVAHTVPSKPSAPLQSIFQDCFEKDSIACVQQTVYRHARELFDRPTIQLFTGMKITKTNDRTARNLEPKVEQAATIQEREVALEDYLVNNAKNFFTERKFTWDVATTSRAISDAIPTEVKESVREFVEERRIGKKIKLIKKLLPFLGLLKLKLIGFAIFAVAAIGAIAKTALVTSFLAIALAGASFLSSIVAKLFGIGGLAKGTVGKISGLGGLKGLGGLAGLGGASGLGGLAGLGGASGLGGAAGLGGGLGGLGGALSGALSGALNGPGAYNSQNNNVEEIIAYTTHGGSVGAGAEGWNSNGWSNTNGWEESRSGKDPQVLAYAGQLPHTRR